MEDAEEGYQEAEAALEIMEEAEAEEAELEEVEDLLEYYLQRATTTQSEAERLLAGSRDLEESIGVSLSARRFEVGPALCTPYIEGMHHQGSCKMSHKDHMLGCTGSCSSGLCLLTVRVCCRVPCVSCLVLSCGTGLTRVSSEVEDSPTLHPSACHPLDTPLTPP